MQRAQLFVLDVFFAGGFSSAVLPFLSFFGRGSSFVGALPAVLVQLGYVSILGFFFVQPHFFPSKLGCGCRSWLWFSRVDLRG